MTNIEKITKETAIEAVRAAAFEVTDEERSDYGRKLIHCFTGFLGADWDLEEVEREIQRAQVVAWNRGRLFGHQLAVQDADGKVWSFDVKAPESPAEVKA